MSPSEREQKELETFKFCAVYEESKKTEQELILRFGREKAPREANRLLREALEKQLERGLTPIEQKAFSGYPLPFAVMEILEALTSAKDEVEAMVRERVLEFSKYGVFERLGRSSRGIQKDFVYLLSTLDPKAREIVATIDIAIETRRFAEWVDRILHAAKPPPGNKVIFLRLTEIDGSCRLKINAACSARALSEDVEHVWASNVGHVPTVDNAKVWAALKETSAEPWWVMQAITLLIARAYFSERLTSFAEKSGLKKFSVTTGFPDGDLYKVSVRPIEFSKVKLRPKGNL